MESNDQTLTNHNIKATSGNARDCLEQIVLLQLHVFGFKFVSGDKKNSK